MFHKIIKNSKPTRKTTAQRKTNCHSAAGTTRKTQRKGHTRDKQQKKASCEKETLKNTCHGRHHSSEGLGAMDEHHPADGLDARRMQKAKMNPPHLEA